MCNYIVTGLTTRVSEQLPRTASFFSILTTHFGAVHHCLSPTHVKGVSNTLVLCSPKLTSPLSNSSHIFTVTVVAARDIRVHQEDMYTTEQPPLAGAQKPHVWPSAGGGPAVPCSLEFAYTGRPPHNTHISTRLLFPTDRGTCFGRITPSHATYLLRARGNLLPRSYTSLGRS